jgi:drug/metabolite transporter (DMT)-like permease
MNNEQKGILFSILSSIFLGFNYIAARLLLNLVNVETMNTIWFMFASILFFCFFILSNRKKDLKIIAKKWKLILVISTLAIMGSILWSYSIFYSGPNQVSFIFQFNTVFTVFLGIAILKERFKKMESLGIFIAIIGVLILTYSNGELNFISTVFTLCSAFFYSLANLIVKIYVKKIDPMTLACGRSFFVFLLFLLYSIITNRIQTSIPSISFFYAFLGGLTGAFIGFTLFFKALEKIKISKVVSIRSIDPLFTVIFSFFILSLIPTANQLLGGILIVIGVIILSLYRVNKNFGIER